MGVSQGILHHALQDSAPLDDAAADLCVFGSPHNSRHSEISSPPRFAIFITSSAGNDGGIFAVPWDVRRASLSLFFYIYNFSALVIFLTPLFPACYCCFPVSVPLGIKEKLYSLISRNEEERNREQETERRSLKPLTRVLGDEGGKIKVLWLQYVAGWSICQHMRPRRRRAGKGRSRGEEKGDLDAI